MVSIRTAEAEDADAVARGEWETARTPGLLVGYPGEIPVAAYARKIAELAELGCYWVAEEDGRVVGHAFLDPLPMAGNAHVFRLSVVVHPGATGRGLGTRLLQEVTRWAAASRRVGKVELLVRATNARAMALYRRFGFIEEGRLRRRVRTRDGVFLDDVAMGWFPGAGTE